MSDVGGRAGLQFGIEAGICHTARMFDFDGVMVLKLLFGVMFIDWDMR